MANPWLSIPLEDYEGHMDSAEVRQLSALADLFAQALRFARPESVAILGIAGGNGLDRIDLEITLRIVGLDINPQYLAGARDRFGEMPGLELHCVDLTAEDLHIAPVSFVHAALVLEHTGCGRALANALTLVEPGGLFSVVLQLPSEIQQGVALTRFTSMQSLAGDFALIDVTEFQQSMADAGFRLVEEERTPLPSGKALWSGVFARYNAGICRES